MVKIILHCSDSSFGNAALISKWHSLPATPVTQNGKSYQGRGWSGIGYHYVILNGWLSSNSYHPLFNGHIETGRALDDDPFIAKSERGAHVKGQNTNSVGICLIGRSGTFTEDQLNAALKLVYMLEEQYEEISIHQHSEFDTKKPHCAGLDMSLFKRNYEIYKEAMIS